MAENINLGDETKLDNNQGAVNQTENKQTETKTYTEDEVQKLIQSESDKRVRQALETKEKKAKEEAARKALEEQGKFNDIIRTDRMNLLNEMKETLLGESFKDIYDFFDLSTFADPTKDFSELKGTAKEKLMNFSKAVNGIIEKQVTERVNAKVKEMEKGTFVDNKNPSQQLPTDINAALKQLFQKNE